MFSRKYCGEGVPLDYIKDLKYNNKCNTNLLERIFGLLNICIPLSKYNFSYNPEGIPNLNDCLYKGNFIDYHKSPELETIYASFFRGDGGVLNAYGNFWKILGKKFKKFSNVIGYDIWNEPWPVNLWNDVYSLIPGFVDNNHLIPFYKHINEYINEVDREYTLFFQAIPFPDIIPLLGGKVYKGFKEVPIKDDIRQQVLNVHNYCCAADQNICRDGEPKMKDKETCKKFHQQKIKVNKEEAQTLRTPLFVTEFGACSSSLSCLYELLNFIEPAEKELISWAYWMYKPFGDHTTTANRDEEGIFNEDGSIQKIKEIALTRTYILKYQGTPLNSTFDGESHFYTSSFLYKKSITAPSVLYTNTNLYYKNGADIKVFDSERKEVKAKIEKIEERYYEILITGNADAIYTIEVSEKK